MGISKLHQSLHLRGNLFSSFLISVFDEADVEVGRAVEGCEEVADAGHVGDPVRPGVVPGLPAFQLE